VIRRFFRLVVLAGVAAGVVAVVRSLTDKRDPLPTPVADPAGGPWPPLRNETEAPKPVVDTPPPTEAAPPATAPSHADEPSATVAPEPGGVPVADEPASGSSWVEPAPDGSCPDGYPVKAKLKSKIFHEPGQLNYDRTTPDRCYRDAATAVADGLRAAKR
jgi:hypothetical protein